MRAHFSWQSAVTKSELAPTAKLVLLVIGMRMNQHGEGAFPSYQTIAEDASVSRRTAIRQVAIAVEAGWLAKETRKSGAINTSNLYSMAYPKQQEIARGSDTHDTTLVTPMTLGGSDTHDTLTPHCFNTPLTQVDSSESNEASSAKPKGRKPSNPDDTEKAFEVYWQAGMVKQSKKKALSLFAAYVKKEKLCPHQFAEKLAGDVKARIAAEQMGFDRLHPTTYINNERWNDEIIADDSSNSARDTADSDDYMMGI